MADKSRDQGNKGQPNHGGDNNRDQSIGNKQGTTQTGGQSSGGNERRQQDDEFSEDLRNSGQRKSRDEDAGT